MVGEQHVLAVTRVESRKQLLSENAKRTPTFTVRRFACAYVSASIIRRGAKPGTEARALNVELALDWTGPFKAVAAGPVSLESTRDGRPLAAKLLYLDLLHDIPDLDAGLRVSTERCIHRYRAASRGSRLRSGDPFGGP